MAQNIEIKVACDVVTVSDILARLGQRGVYVTETLTQTDTYFRATNGRLKLRAIEGESTELVQYLRADISGPRLSDYRRIPVSGEPGSSLLAALSESLGILAIVHKTRRVAIWKSTRIHLDEVEGLGHFIELETMLPHGGEDPEAAQREFDDIVDWLDLAQSSSIAGSYSDLVLTERHQS